MKLDWRQSILYVTTMGMEGCWLYALIVLLNMQVADGYLSTMGLLLLYPLSFGFNKLLQQLRWPRVCLRSINWLAWVVGMLLIVKIQLFSDLGWSDLTWLLAVPQAIVELIHTFRPELLILVSTAALWWLGRRLAYLRLNFTTSVSEFQFGLPILLIAFVVTSRLTVDLADSVPIIMAFFFFALSGISIAHAKEGTSWLSGLSRGHWSGLLLLSITLILLFGVLISSVVTPDLLQLVWDGLKWIWELIMKAIAFIASLFPEPEPAELPPLTPMPEIEPSEGFNWWIMSESVRGGLRIGWYVLVFGFLIYALWKISSQIFSWLRRKLASMTGAELEPLPSSFRADFLILLKRILRRLLGLRLSFLFGWKSRSILPEKIASVRQIYRQLLQWAASSGYPRLIFQTPQEYLNTLVDLLPQAQEDLDFITQQYVSMRYGLSLPTEDKLNQLRESWHKIRQNHLKRQGNEYINK